MQANPSNPDLAGSGGARSWVGYQDSLFTFLYSLKVCLGIERFAKSLMCISCVLSNMGTREGGN